MSCGYSQLDRRNGILVLEYWNYYLIIKNGDIETI